ncbi:amidophosphoribosyltransferase [Candidatus Dependentiae bacterium]|nr:amidophosphoribosyltransferase [Candidatus Dependentiae bacterium]
MNQILKFLSLYFFSFSIFAEHINHECGIALVRLLKPLNHYVEKYDDPEWGLKKVCMLMEKQRNRGQDGVGLAFLKLDMPAGTLFFKRIRSAKENALEDLFNKLVKKSTNQNCFSTEEIKIKNLFAAEIYLGHLRYGTFAGNGIGYCQPFVRKHNEAEKNFALAGNFNLTNIEELKTKFNLKNENTADTQIIIDLICNAIDENENLELSQILKNIVINFDGGFVFSGILGNGDIFILRDPYGIRPAFFYKDEEVFAASSEKSALMSTFNADQNDIFALKPGHIIIVKKNGQIEEHNFVNNQFPVRQCTFERIYFSRASDPQIYHQRKMLGKNLASRVIEAINSDIQNTVFTYVPNTSEIAFLGLVEEIRKLTNQNVRTEKIITKDQLLRTFITRDESRIKLVNHIYDFTKDLIKPTDALVVVDDSIVRGTTLRESIIKELINLNPKKIIIVSSAPMIMYPDCYGIDMSQIGKLIAFNAAIALLKENNKEELIDKIAQNCNEDCKINNIEQIYKLFSQQDLENKISQMLTPKNINWAGTVQVIFQTIEGLHNAMPEYKGDWYFTGQYPTNGGYKVVNKSFLNWYNGASNLRAY